MIEVINQVFFPLTVQWLHLSRSLDGMDATSSVLYSSYPRTRFNVSDEEQDEEFKNTNNNCDL